MFFRAHIPQPPLSDFVDSLWLYEGYARPHVKEHVLPTGTTGLVINLREDARDTTTVGGAQSQFFVLDTSEPMSVIGVHFKPGGAFPFLKVPAHELQDLFVTLDELWGQRAGELRERLLEARTPEAKFSILEQALLAQAAGRFARHPAVRFALNEFRSVQHLRRITDVTDQIGLSARRFIEVFRKEVGLTPKVFCRIRRFQGVLHSVATAKQGIDWADIALSCGYFDQAHFIHDFRVFSGVNPSTYLRYRGESPNHVTIPD